MKNDPVNELRKLLNYRDARAEIIGEVARLDPVVERSGRKECFFCQVVDPKVPGDHPISCPWLLATLRADAAEPQYEIDVDGEAVALQPAQVSTGWAIFTCSDGEPQFFAFLDDLDAAERVMRACETHPAEEHRLFAAAPLPAVVDGNDIVAANHANLAKGAEAVIKYAGLGNGAAEPLREVVRSRLVAKGCA